MPRKVRPPVHNPMCDGSHCTYAEGEVRLYPLGPKGTLAGNLILCRACWAYENGYNAKRRALGAAPEAFPPRKWEEAEIYPKT